MENVNEKRQSVLIGDIGGTTGGLCITRMNTVYIFIIKGLW
jgi:hypothetical protein